MRLVQIIDSEDMQTVFFAKTDMTNDEIVLAVNDETLDEKHFDYEEKCLEHAKRKNKFFERLDDVQKVLV